LLYFIGGAPRAGKSILGQRIAAQLKIGWISTDLLAEILRVKNEEGMKHEWNAAPEAIVAVAEWFFPYLDRFAWGVSSLAESYVIEGVSFLPAQIVQLSAQYPVRSVFLGCSHMTLERFDRFPGRSRGYAELPVVMRRQIVQDVPRWSEFIRQEAERFGYPYVDMSDDFPSRLHEAGAVLTASRVPDERDSST
jgi:2-phosphoglycerate kinase